LSSRQACPGLPSVKYFSVVRRNLASVVAVCSLLWAVSGVMVLALALHEHGHPVENHYDAIQTALHGHAHEDSPDHDHELTAPLSASRTLRSVHSHAMVSQPNDLVDAAVSSVGTMANSMSEPRDFGPPPYLLHCVLLT